MNIRHALVALAASALISAAASAHHKLLTASPAAKSTVMAPARIELRFSERLMPKMSGASIVMRGSLRDGATRRVLAIARPIDGDQSP